jgi:hypothetical protein
LRDHGLCFFGVRPWLQQPFCRLIDGSIRPRWLFDTKSSQPIVEIETVKNLYIHELRDLLR